MDQVIRIKGGNVTITGSEIRQKQVFTVDFKCLMSQKTINELESRLNQQAQQLASSTNQALNLNPGSTKSENITNYITDIKTSILNSYKAECVNAARSQQFIDIEATGNVDITDATLSQEQTGKIITNCILNSETYNEAKNNIEQVISQESESTVESPLNFFNLWIVGGIIAFVIILIIIVLVIYFVKK